MPWKESNRVSERRYLVQFAPGGNVSELARRFGISRKTAYKWLRRAESGDELEDRSRRPRCSPGRTPREVEALVLAMRAAHPAWGGRKLRHLLVARGIDVPPAPSTITEILRRHGRIKPPLRPARDWQRFEAAAPNDLWQMDFKGHLPAGARRCHPLTVLDDHSRYSIALEACADERSSTVRLKLQAAFRQHGLPEAILTDNGSPWGGGGPEHPHTALTAWLMRLGIGVLHGRPHHPQTQGKDERFHRTLKAEVLNRRPVWHSLDQMQQAFDEWRAVYNLERPHEALGNRPPVQRYTPSARSFPEMLPPIEYGPNDVVRMVHDHGRVQFRGRILRVSRAFIGQPVALRPAADGVWDIYYCHQRISRADLRQPKEV